MNLEYAAEWVKNNPVPVIIGFVASLFGIAPGIAWLLGLFPRLGLSARRVMVIRKLPEHGSSEPSSCHRQRRQIQCPLCKGSGNKWRRYEATCHKCNGRGYIYTCRVGQPKCPQCAGTGFKNGRYESDCPICGGIGLLPFEKDDRG